MFLDPAFQALMVDWEASARSVIAKFRVDFAQAGADPAFRSLVGDLSFRSAAFTRLLPLHEVSPLGEGVKRLRHPVLGEMDFQHAVFAVEGWPGLRLVVYTSRA
jgi:hypothetical protein